MAWNNFELICFVLLWMKVLHIFLEMIISNLDLSSLINFLNLFFSQCISFSFFISRNVKLDGPPPFYDFDPKRHQKKNQSHVADKTCGQSLSQRGKIIVFLEGYIWLCQQLVLSIDCVLLLAPWDYIFFNPIQKAPPPTSLMSFPSVTSTNVFPHFTPRLWNTGLVSSRDILTSWGEGASSLGWPPF